MKKILSLLAFALLSYAEALGQLPFSAGSVVKTVNCYEDDSIVVSIASVVGDYCPGQTQYVTDVLCFSNKTNRQLHISYQVVGLLSSSHTRFSYEYTLLLKPKEVLSDLVQSHCNDQRFVHDTDCKAIFQLKEYHSTPEKEQDE